MSKLTQEQLKLSLVKLHKKLVEIDDRYNRINAGGCAYFAVALKKKLKEFGMNPRMVIVNQRGNLLKYVNASSEHVSLASANEKGMGISHVMLKIGKYFIDCTGVRDTLSGTQWTRYTGGLVKKSKEEVIEGWLKEKDRWNPAFNQKQLPSIYQDIKDIKL